MSTRAGIWIDRSRARVVLLSGEDARLLTVESEVESRHKTTGERAAGRAGALIASGAKRYEHRRENDKARFYEQVIGVLNGVEEIVVLGPGPAKLELAGQMQRHHGLVERVREVRSGDSRVTDAQLIAEVRDLFHQPSPRLRPDEEARSHTPGPIGRKRG